MKVVFFNNLRLFLHQIRSEEQGIALSKLLKVATDEFKEIIPQELDVIHRNITGVVLSNTIPRYPTLPFIFPLQVKIMQANVLTLLAVSDFTELLRSLFTARIRRMGEGNVFSLSTSGGGGTHIP